VLRKKNLFTRKAWGLFSHDSKCSSTFNREIASSKILYIYIYIYIYIYKIEMYKILTPVTLTINIKKKLKCVVFTVQLFINHFGPDH
jgi:hypothetical protein